MKITTLPIHPSLHCAASVSTEQSSVGPWAVGYHLRWRHHLKFELPALAQFPTQEAAALEGVMAMYHLLRKWGAPGFLRRRFLEFAKTFQGNSFTNGHQFTQAQETVQQPRI